MQKLPNMSSISMVLVILLIASGCQSESARRTEAARMEGDRRALETLRYARQQQAKMDAEIKEMMKTALSADNVSAQVNAMLSASDVSTAKLINTLKSIQTAMDVIANNLVNVNTAGYKKMRLRFQTTADGGSEMQSLVRDFTDGSLIDTGLPLDLAIVGDGFFQVQTPEDIGGGIAYTRAGNFNLNRSGEIVDANGYRLLPIITVPAETTFVTIQQNGQVIATQPGNIAVNIGTIQLARFINPGGLVSVGQNLFIETPGSGAPIVADPITEGAGQLRQGFLEGSNVNLIEEMSNMIMLQNWFDGISRAVNTIYSSNRA